MTHRGVVRGLAAQAGVEVIALFVEQTQLLRFASLPVAREISMVSLEWRQPEPAALERSLRAHAREAERMLAAAARRAAEAREPTLRILLADEDQSAASRWAEQVRERLAEQEPGLRLEIERAADAAALAAALRAAGPCVVILG
jgi:hypothetical protein